MENAKYCGLVRKFRYESVTYSCECSLVRFIVANYLIFGFLFAKLRILKCRSFTHNFLPLRPQKSQIDKMQYE